MSNLFPEEAIIFVRAVGLRFSTYERYHLFRGPDNLDSKRLR